jgi:Na+:H+ antiporter, NhaA family
VITDSYLTPIERLTLPVRRQLHAAPAGGLVLLACAAVAMVWANSPAAHSYHVLWETPIEIGIGDWRAGLSLHAIVNDGLMAVFFFLVGLEIKREVLVGELASMRQAALPVAAALGGMLVPALLYLALNPSGPTMRGWGIPMATDIAFALGVLALLGDRFPPALRIFLSALAIADDLGAVLVIALFYTASVSWGALAAAAGLLVLSLAANAIGVRAAWAYALIGLALWVAVLLSGVHATVAGVLLAFTVPVVRSDAAGGPDAGPGLAEHFEHRLRPLSAGVAVPVFAFFSAGVAVGGLSGLGAALGDSIAIGIIVGLIAGKAVGITAATWLVSRFTRAQLDENLGWADVVGLSLLGGIGFTVSLLITELAYGAESTSYDSAKVGILAGTLAAALLATVVLRLRNRRYRVMYEAETRDVDADGIPDAWDPVDDRRDRPFAEG